MKRYVIALVLLVALGAQAQEVSTLYFLENAPMRHLVNPAFQPVSKGYLNFTPIGYFSLWTGNNALTLSDFIYAAPNGQTVTLLHPEYGNRDQFIKSLPKSILSQQDATINWFSLGSRIKEKGYFTLQIMTKIDSKQFMSSGIFSHLLNGATVSPTSPNLFSLGSSGLATQIYTEIGGGYSHKINDVWTVGGKLKFLVGSAYIGSSFSQMDITGSTQFLQIQGKGDILLAGPLNFAALPSQLSYDTFGLVDFESLLWMDNDENITQLLSKFIKPSGYGAALDLGFTATPLKQLQISVGLNDLGFIYWNNAGKYTAAVDTTFTGVGTFNYGDYVYDGVFHSDSLIAHATQQLMGYADAIRLGNPVNKFCRMITTKLNVGVDGRFFNNRLSVGVLSKTMLYNGHLNEEVTFGVAGKPANWFNIALSYSLLNNGKYSNIGAGLSIMPYDGINLTLAADYIPLYYAPLNGINIIPSRSKGFNVALGFSIVWGTNPKKVKVKEPEKEEVIRQAIQIKADKPVVSDVQVAHVEAAFDSNEVEIADRDKDGVPDWEDECPDLAGPAFNKGCPEIKKELRTLLKKAMQGIQFETDKDIIRKSSFPILNKIAVQFIQHPEYVIEVQGHTDNSGDYDHNVDLSQRRAQSVMNYLVEAGVNPEHMTAVGYGPDRPIADNDTPEGKALNRRVEFDIQFEQIQIETIYEHADSISIETVNPE